MGTRVLCSGTQSCFGGFGPRFARDLWGSCQEVLPPSLGEVHATSLDGRGVGGGRETERTAVWGLGISGSWGNLWGVWLQLSQVLKPCPPGLSTRGWPPTHPHRRGVQQTLLVPISFTSLETPGCAIILSLLSQPLLRTGN